MLLSAILYLSCFKFGLVSAFHVPVSHAKREAEQNATLYAYGGNSLAWPIAYGVSDGLLYITKSPDDSSTKLSPLTWNLPSFTGESLIVNATFANGTSAGSMYINTEDNNTVGVLPTTQIANINETVSGFALLATQLIYINNTAIEAQFWAKSTNTDGVYRLVWIANGETPSPSDSFPVIVKGEKNSEAEV